MDPSHIILLFGIGLFVGFIGTLIGAGGGFILVPVLLLLFPHLRPEAITSISLAIVFLNASSGSIAYAKMKRIDYKTAFIFAVATIPGAILGAYLTRYIPKRTFDLLLGGLLVFIAFFLLIKPHYKKSSIKSGRSDLIYRSLTDNKGQHYEYSFNKWTGIVISFVVGYLSSLLGIGGGIIHVPALTSLLNFPIHIATATSHLILAVMALAGTVVHIIQGNLKDQWFTVLYIGIGVIIGAQAGAYFSHHAKPNWIVRALAVALLLVGIRIIFM
jgi:uncharacterized membrane protein YfcA